MQDEDLIQLRIDGLVAALCDQLESLEDKERAQQAARVSVRLMEFTAYEIARNRTGNCATTIFLMANQIEKMRLEKLND